MPKNILLELENVGYLKYIAIELKPGINIIRAPNASGKTSLIRGLTSMFSDNIPPSHILALNEVKGKIKVHYNGKKYEKRFRRTPQGSVISSGNKLPFADHRVFDACVALAETGVVHKITGGGTIFRDFLENLSYGKYYSEIISIAQELSNDLSRELVGPNFRKFEELPLLLTELTDLHIKIEQNKQKIANLQSIRETEIQKLINNLKEKKSELSREETELSSLKNYLLSEENKEDQLLKYLMLTDDSTEIASQIREGISQSKTEKKKIQKTISQKIEIIKKLKLELGNLASQIDEKKSQNIEGLEELEKSLQRINKDVILKEEEIERSEKFPDDDHRYPKQLVIEVRSYMIKKIEWLNKVSEYFEDKYMRRMTLAKVRFNNNITKAFKELGFKGFENLFLNQDFELNIVREGNIQQPVETLSASEKLTVSIILMLAAKETFLSDFPLFIIDELTLSYDHKRFEKVVSYLKRRIPFVIVTSLSKGGEKKPKIIHEI
jgi:hypothetical protein